MLSDIKIKESKQGSSNQYATQAKRLNRWVATMGMSLGILMLSACGSSSDEPEELIVASAPCITSDEDLGNPDCGSLFLGLTDADGDFLTYSVEVTAIQLTRRDGTHVSVMPSMQMIDFADYVEVSELATAATIPLGVYEEGSITVSYQNADIQVEKSGEAVAAQMIDEQGQNLTSATLQLQLDGDNPLVITRNRPAFLEIDFDLTASHTVNLEAEPITVTTEPFIIAEVDPVMNKELRIRGPLIKTNEDESFFRVAVRPFHRRDGRFGGVNLHVDSDTQFDINGEAFTGEAGLAQLATLEPGIPTVTQGLFERNNNQVGALTVLAGSSVPGSELDAARGVIVAREGDLLTIKGASLIRTSSDVSFNDEVRVLIGEMTSVKKSRKIEEEVSIDALSVGQAVTLLGTLTEDDQGLLLDASEGAVKMRLSYASGHAAASDSLQINMALQSLQGRNPEIFNFTGTGISEEFDANPTDYEVSVANLATGDLASGDPIRVSGFVSAFGSAPADFEALNLINYAESRSQLYANWPSDSEEVALSEIGSNQLVLNAVVTETEGTYLLKQGGIRTDLTTLESSVIIIPREERGIYTIRSGDSVMAFSDFGDFTTALQQQIDAGEKIDMMHAMGGFVTDSTTLHALKIAVKLY